MIKIFYIPFLEYRMHFDMKNYINSEEFGMQLLYRILKLYMHAVVYKK